MIRAKVAFAVSPTMSHAEREAAAEEGQDTRELFSEQQVAEDFEFGSRVQAAGFKSAFIDENLATGEVRWARAAAAGQRQVLVPRLRSRPRSW